jgi:hypothetical protein
VNVTCTVRAFLIAVAVSGVASGLAVAAPGEPVNVKWCSGAKDCLSWDAASPPGSYTILRGSPATYAALLNANADSCIRANFTARTTGSLLTESPSPGGLLWYLVQAKTCTTSGTAGAATAGPRVVNVFGNCTPATCADGIRDAAETDLDCGGGTCAPCALTRNCCAAADCASLHCAIVSEIGTCVATAPAAPTAVFAAPGSGQATVRFWPPTDNGGAAITGYTATSSPGGWTGTSGSNTIVVLGLQNGIQYTFTVRATNSVGTGPSSAPSNPVTVGSIGSNGPGSAGSSICVPSTGTCSTSGASSYLTRSLAYSTTTGIFSGSITTNQCPHSGDAWTYDGVFASGTSVTASCVVQTIPSYTLLPAAAPLRARVGIAIRGGENIYGPMDSGVSQGQACTNGLGQCPAGTDIGACESSLFVQCGHANVEDQKFVSDCGGHAQPWHHHCNLTCEYDQSAETGHSLLVGVMLDGRGLYGMHEATNTKPADLDACGGHYGNVPATTVNGVTYPAATNVYHYHTQAVAPYTIGCFGPVYSLAQAKALYATCGQVATPLCTSKGAIDYDLDCPVYNSMPSGEKYNQVVPTGACPCVDASCTLVCNP